MPSYRDSPLQSSPDAKLILIIVARSVAPDAKSTEDNVFVVNADAVLHPMRCPHREPKSVSTMQRLTAVMQGTPERIRKVPAIDDDDQDLPQSTAQPQHFSTATRSTAAQRAVVVIAFLQSTRNRLATLGSSQFHSRFV